MKALRLCRTLGFMFVIAGVLSGFDPPNHLMSTIVIGNGFLVLTLVAGFQFLAEVIVRQVRTESVVTERQEPTLRRS
jgi:hypothetical protein